MDNYNRTRHLVLVVSLQSFEHFEVISGVVVDWVFQFTSKVLNIHFTLCSSKNLSNKKEDSKTNCAVITSIPSSTVYKYTFIYNSPYCLVRFWRGHLRACSDHNQCACEKLLSDCQSIFCGQILLTCFLGCVDCYETKANRNNVKMVNWKSN